MKPHLIRKDGPFPPGAYTFFDSVTGKSYQDSHTLFDERVRQIINDRNANHRLFTNEKLVDFEYVSQQLSEQICERLNGNPTYCTGLPVPVATVVAPPVPAGRTCRFCGSGNLEAVLCATCGGSKIDHWLCKDCKKENYR